MNTTKNKENNEKKQHLKEGNSCEKANDTKTDMKNCENEQRVFETKKKAYKFFTSSLFNGHKSLKSTQNCLKNRFLYGNIKTQQRKTKILKKITKEKEKRHMKALARYGKEFGGYRMIDVPVPECGPEDIILEIKAAAICGADMKHFRVENGSDEFNSIRGHEFAGEIVKVGEKVKDWKVGQRVVSDNSGHVCGVCPACEMGDFLCCEEKVNLGLDNNRWGGGFTKYCKVPGEILRIHKHAIWEIPEGVKYEEAAVLDPICNSYKAIAQQSKFLPGQDVVVFGTGPLGLFAVQIARIMGAVNIVMVGLDEDTKVRFDVAKELGATHCVNASKEDVVARCTEICGRDNLGLVVECSGANIALKQAIEMLRPNGEVVRVGMGFKPLDFSINDITAWNKSIIGHMAYDSTSWRNAIRLLASGQIKVQPMITHRIGLSQWEEGFTAMANKEAIKVIMTYDYDD